MKKKVKKTQQSTTLKKGMLTITPQMTFYMENVDLFSTSKYFLIGWFMVFNFQQYFSYIMAVSLIGGGNRNNQRKPPTSHKPLINFIT